MFSFFESSSDDLTQVKVAQRRKGRCFKDVFGPKNFYSSWLKENNGRRTS